MTFTDQLFENAERYAKAFHESGFPLPAKQIAIVACMEARFRFYDLPRLTEGDVHVIRNAGMLTFTDDTFRQQIQTDTSIKPSWAAEAFSDLDTDVRQSIVRVQAEPSISIKGPMNGIVHEVGNQTLRTVSPS